MCIYCDLFKTDEYNILNEEAKRANNHIDLVIHNLDRLSSFYKKIKYGSLKPHTGQMGELRLYELAIIKEFIQYL